MPRLLPIVALVLGAAAIAAGDATPRALELIKARQYEDAIRTLEADLKARPESETGQQQFWTGECHYLLRRYELARSFFTKAMAHLPEVEKGKAEYRLACTLFRLKDPGAEARIDGYLATRGLDRNGSTLLLFKMRILADRGRASMEALEAIHGRLYGEDGRAARVDAATLTEADQILCGFYTAQRLDDKAFALFRRISSGLRTQIEEAEKAGRPVPPAVGRQSDSVALQLGSLYLERKDVPEAQKWLGSVRHDTETVARARLLLARLAFERGDAKQAQEIIQRGDLLALVPKGALRSDLHLMLGLAEQARSDARPAKIEEWLGQVGPESRGHAQAQTTLGEIYLARSLWSEALKRFEAAKASPDYEARALHGIATARISQLAGNDLSGHGKAADAALRELFARHALSPSAREAKRTLIEVLAKRGFDVSYARSDEDKVAVWQRTARERPGSADAANALVSLAREHARVAVDAKGVVAKAADHAAAAAACDRLLDAKVYQGQGLASDAWAGLQVDALVLRAGAELATLAGPRRGIPGAAPTLLPTASARIAIELLTQAKARVDAKDNARVKAVEIGLVEAMFRSDQAEDRVKAEARYAELEADYGDDPRFQKLALDIADSWRDQGRPVDAAKLYLRVARRAKGLAGDDVARLFFAAGGLYSQAAVAMQRDAKGAHHAILIRPRPVIAIGDEALRTSAALTQVRPWTWPRDREGMTSGADLLRHISGITGVPFSWPMTADEYVPPHSIEGMLRRTRAKLPEEPISAMAAITAVLDPATFGFEADAGIIATTRTKVPPRDDDGPEPAAIEVFDRKLGNGRFAPLQKEYGHGTRGDGRGGMFLHMVQRVESLTGMRVLWHEAVDREAKLAVEFAEVPNIGRHKNRPIHMNLTNALDSMSLTWSVVRARPEDALFDAAKDCYNEVYKRDARSGWGERALMAVARDFHSRGDHERMRGVLREYLKTFDASTNQYWHEANFWVGWCLEQERKFHDATIHYARAAEERLVLVASAATSAAIDRTALRRRLGYETAFVLNEPMEGSFTAAAIDAVVEAVRARTHLPILVAPGATGRPVTLAPFARRPAFEVLCDALDAAGLDVRAEHLDPGIGERALFRMASAQRKDGLLPQAVDTAGLLLERYPETKRRREAYQLLLDAYRGLNRFGDVVATLDRLAATTRDPDERRRLEIENAWLRFDMADYAAAVERLRPLLDAAPAGEERLRLRDGYARALLRAGRHADAAAQYEQLAAETTGWAARLARLQAAGSKAAGGVAATLPDDELAFLRRVNGMTADERQAMSTTEQVRMAWILWVQAQEALRAGQRPRAVELLQAVGSGREESLGADALVQAARLEAEAGRTDDARKTLEYLLISTSVAESRVRAAFLLAELQARLGRGDAARQRWQQVIEQWPLSPLAGEARRRLAALPAAATAAPAAGGAR